MTLATELPNRPGTYVLQLRSRGRRTIGIGRIGELTLLEGYYLYVGSAFGPGGLGARLGHHFEPSSRTHWHVDYLRRHTDLIGVWLGLHGTPQEHRWALAMSRGRGMQIQLPGFGASDCSCKSHLFFAARQPSISSFRRRLRSLGLAGDVRAWAP
jgi:Uri superfamily endonuclease